jgi:hypothetical protein
MGNDQQWLFTDLVRMSKQDHEPLGTLDHFPTVDDAFRAMPLSSALQISASHLRHKVLVRGEKDARLKDIIETFCKGRHGLILNPCCVFARHARDIALRLPTTEVLATDIDPHWEKLFRIVVKTQSKREPTNFSFRTESIYDCRVDHQPLAVCFFGGCGSLTDAALKIAVHSQATFVVGRACCHENIGMNSTISTWDLTIWNLGHRAKNVVYRYCAKRFGHYFHTSASIRAYPTSHAFRAMLNPGDMLRCAQHAVDCRLCQLVIDLDRNAFLYEHGYSILGYSENMFVAVRNGAGLGFRV